MSRSCEIITDDDDDGDVLDFSVFELFNCAVAASVCWSVGLSICPRHVFPVFIPGSSGSV